MSNSFKNLLHLILLNIHYITVTLFVSSYLAVIISIQIFKLIAK